MNKQDWRGSLRLRRQRCGVCGGVRGDGIACQGMRASIDSPESKLSVSIIQNGFQVCEVLSIATQGMWSFSKKGKTHSSSTSHRTQQAPIDLNDLLHRLTRNPVSGCSSGVRRNDDSTLESESQCRCTVSELNRAVRVCIVVGSCSQPRGRLFHMCKLSRSSNFTRKGVWDTYLCYWGHGESEGQAWDGVVELLLVILRVTFIFEHRPTVSSYEGIHLESIQ